MFASRASGCPLSTRAAGASPGADARKGRGRARVWVGLVMIVFLGCQSSVWADDSASCGIPDDKPNAMRSPSGNTVVNANEVVTYTCLPGFTTDGTANGATSFTSVCLSTGQYTNVLTECQGKKTVFIVPDLCPGYRVREGRVLWPRPRPEEPDFMRPKGTTPGLSMVFFGQNCISHCF